MISELEAVQWLIHHMHGSVGTLPLDLWSPKLRQEIARGAVRSEKPPEDDLGAKEYLRALALGYVARGAAVAQRKPGGDTFDKALAAYHQLISVIDPPLVESFDRIELRERVFVPTGIVSMDEQIAGLAPGEFGIVAMPSGKGKSLVMITMAAESSVAGRSVLYVSVGDQSKDELVPRMDTCILGTESPRFAGIDVIRQRHIDALQYMKAPIWIADYTDRECRLRDIERLIRKVKPKLVIVDHADDVISEFSHDPAATRHSLTAIYKGLKRMAVAEGVPIWTASQTPEASWNQEVAGISSLSEAKTGKASGAAVVLVFTQGFPHRAGEMACHIAKARRHILAPSFWVYYDYVRCRVW